MSEWKPIETGPKDGTTVLICGHTSAGKYFVADAQYGGEWLLFDVHNDQYSEPCFACSHWMPLPEPPQQSA